MSEIKHQLYVIEDKTSDEVLLINGFQHINQLIQQEKQQLQNNWNELKEHLKKQIVDSKAGSGQHYYFNAIYRYMEEMEGKND